MQKIRLIILFTCLGATLGILGCAQAPDKKIPLTVAHKKLVKFCQKHFGFEIKLKPFPNTVWIYIPLESRLVETKANQTGPVKNKETVERWQIKYLDGRVEDGTLHIEYDIGRVQKYKVDPGLSGTYLEKFSKIQRDIVTAIANTYIEAEEAPEFFVTVITDIENGVEFRMIQYLKDIVRGVTDQTFYEEYVKRLIIEEMKGRPESIGDRHGNYLDAHDLTWADFILKQILYRTSFKYTQSDFTPSDNTKEELLKIIKTTVAAYNFSDFERVTLHDLRTGEINR